MQLLSHPHTMILCMEKSQMRNTLNPVFDLHQKIPTDEKHLKRVGNGTNKDYPIPVNNYSNLIQFTRDLTIKNTQVYRNRRICFGFVIILSIIIAVIIAAASTKNHSGSSPTVSPTTSPTFSQLTDTQAPSTLQPTSIPTAAPKGKGKKVGQG